MFLLLGYVAKPVVYPLQHALVASITDNTCAAVWSWCRSKDHK